MQIGTQREKNDQKKRMEVYKIVYRIIETKQYNVINVVFISNEISHQKKKKKNKKKKRKKTVHMNMYKDENKCLYCFI